MDEISNLVYTPQRSFALQTGVGKAVQMGADIWATSWIKGVQFNKGKAAHQKGIWTFAFTLDRPVAIKEFMEDSAFDGITTNRSSAIAYRYYSRLLPPGWYSIYRSL